MTEEIDEIVIRSMMREIILERRKLTKKYYVLKEQLECNGNRSNEEKSDKKNDIISVIYHSDKHRVSNIITTPSKKFTCVPYERVAGYIVMILKEAGVPLANRDVFNQLSNEYDIYLSYQNFTNNILPKIRADGHYPVEKAYHGFCQYHQKGCDPFVR